MDDSPPGHNRGSGWKIQNDRAAIERAHSNLRGSALPSLHWNIHPDFAPTPD